jgi:fatty acid/phospholipid biosynthesis enzyme
LGVNGIEIICHGSASATAIYNAIRMAGRFVTDSVTPELRAAVAGHAALFAAAKKIELSSKQGAADAGA